MSGIWKDVVGYKSIYEVNNLWRIKRLKGKYVPNDKILKSKKI